MGHLCHVCWDWSTPKFDRKLKPSGVYLYMVEICISRNQHQGHPKIAVPDESLGGCDNSTLNWPYQDHIIPYLVLSTTECLPALCPDSDHWTHTPGMHSMAAKSWWILHNSLIGDPLWDDPWGLHAVVAAWMLLTAACASALLRGARGGRDRSCKRRPVIRSTPQTKLS